MLQSGMECFSIREIDRFVARDDEGNEATIVVLGHFKRDRDATGQFLESLERTEATTLGGAICTWIDNDTVSYFDVPMERFRTLQRVK